MPRLCERPWIWASSLSVCTDQVQVATNVEVLSLPNAMYSTESEHPEVAESFAHCLSDMCLTSACAPCMPSPRSDRCRAQVDVDLSPEQFAAKVSRQQARLFLKSDGAFRLANTGRRKFLVNNCQVRDMPCLHAAPRSVQCAL